MPWHQKENGVSYFETDAGTHESRVCRIQEARNLTVDATIRCLVQIAADGQHGPIRVWVLGEHNGDGMSHSVGRGRRPAGVYLRGHVATLCHRRHLRCRRLVQAWSGRDWAESDEPDLPSAQCAIARASGSMSA